MSIKKGYASCRLIFFSMKISKVVRDFEKIFADHPDLLRRVKEAMGNEIIGVHDDDYEAQYHLALTLFEGYNIERNPDMAADILMRLANIGFLNAQYEIATRLASGFGIEKDESSAFDWFFKTACQGHRQAQYATGLFYYEGGPVVADPFEALYWFQKAAFNNEPLAQHNLGCMYLEGIVVPKSNLWAYAWLWLALNNGVNVEPGLPLQLIRTFSDTEKEESGQIFNRIVEKIRKFNYDALPV